MNSIAELEENVAAITKEDKIDETVLLEYLEAAQSSKAKERLTEMLNDPALDISHYAKRALTLLNSLLIFNGVFAETYTKRIKIAEEYASRGMIPLSQSEIETLELFTEYKISGSFQHLLDSFQFLKIDDLIRFQKKFLEKLTIKILNRLEKLSKRCYKVYMSKRYNIT